ncbi:(2Fe-2S)-binding protein [Streptomyces sp. NBC_01304]|uniref:(2Fe-2S)-binding protein n=1 Tax=Streptomyces sp. NBC_01304 TaxID=2903818 RepID=UPI002E140547|nr:(2Fe-2S)-binding protein [Streptomyces sp. NBC_01304]
MSGTNGYGNGAGDGPGYGGWEPTPQGDYDAEATAFVRLPEGMMDGLADFEEDTSRAPGSSPLAAPGSGFVPPQISQISVSPGAATDPAATGTFVIPHFDAPQAAAAPAVQWPEPNAPQPPAPEVHDPGATGQWSFSQTPAAAASAGSGHSNVTGQWSIPLADGDLPDESGEFTQSSLVEQWGGNAPATLPGGAPAPWAEALAAEQQVEEALAPEPAPETEPEPELSTEAGATGEAPEVEQEPAPASAAEEPSLESDSDLESPAPAEQAEPAEESAPVFHDEHPLASYVLRVNGADRPVTDAWIGESLLYVLRERLGLAGAKDGCSQGECGACAVQVDGRLVASCLVPAATAAGSEVRTVEGLATDGQPSDVQRALSCSSAVQCGFCIPGMAMTVHDLLEGNPAPTERETRQALCGNLCRCSGYQGVLDAVRDVVAEREASASSADEAKQASDDTARIPHQARPGAGGINPEHYPQNPQNPQNPQDYPQDGGLA